MRHPKRLSSTQALLNAGASVTAVSKDGETPLHVVPGGYGESQICQARQPGEKGSTFLRVFHDGTFIPSTFCFIRAIQLLFNFQTCCGESTCASLPEHCGTYVRRLRRDVTRPLPVLCRPEVRAQHDGARLI